MNPLTSDHFTDEECSTVEGPAAGENCTFPVIRETPKRIGDKWDIAADTWKKCVRSSTLTLYRQSVCYTKVLSLLLVTENVMQRHKKVLMVCHKLR